MSTVKVWDISLQRQWFDAIVFHGKTVEGRKGSPKWIDIKVGDVIRFVSAEKEKEIQKKVIAVRKYNNITTFLEHEGLIHVLPGIHSITEAVQKVYKAHPIGWTSEEIRLYGVLAIEFTSF